MKKYISNKRKAGNTSSEVQLTKSTSGKTIRLVQEEDISNEIRSEEKIESIVPHFEREMDSVINKIKETRITETKKDLPMETNNKILTETILHHFENSICVHRSFSRSWARSSIIEYYWEIDSTICETEKEFFSATFPETSLYRIKLTIDNSIPDLMKRTLRFYIVTEMNFRGTCNVYVVRKSDWFKIPGKSTSGLISNMTFLFESTLESLQEYLDDSSFMMYFEIGVILKYFTESIHIDVPANTLVNDLNSKQLIKCKNENKEHIKFNVKGESYSVSKKALYATNSNYFERICDSANLHEVEINEDPLIFKEMVSFITFNTISDPFGYYLLRDLLTMATKYDVQALKNLCECNLIYKINIYNVIDLIPLAFSCNATCLKKYSLLFIKLYLQEIIRTNEYQLLPEDVLDKISELIFDVNTSLDVKLPHVDTL